MFYFLEVYQLLRVFQLPRARLLVRDHAVDLVNEVLLRAHVPKLWFQGLRGDYRRGAPIQDAFTDNLSVVVHHWHGLQSCSCPALRHRHRFRTVVADILL